MVITILIMGIMAVTVDGISDGIFHKDTLLNNPNPDKPEKILQFLHISSTIKKNVGGCVHVTYR